MAKTQEEEFYSHELISVSKLIQKYYDIFQLNANNVKTLAPNLSNLQNEFGHKYLKFSKIKRFAIPFIGRISCGKSTFLGFLTGLNEILETNSDIETKIVCIIRHNIFANKPKAFSVVLERRELENEKENDYPKFNFEKGKELEGNINEIIKKKINI